MPWSTQKLAQGCGAARLAKFRHELLVTQMPRNRSKCAKVLAPSRCRDEQKKHEINWLAVNRVEMNWPVQSHEHAEKLF